MSIGNVISAVGLATSFIGKKKASKASSSEAEVAYELGKEQIALAKEQFQFQKDQYADWKAVYGDIQTNLGEYYKNLGSDKIVALGLQNQQTEFQKAQMQVERNFAQRGLTGSGAEMAVKANSTFQNAEARARIRSEGPEKVAAQKLQFLGIGLGQGTQMLQTIAQSGNTAVGAYNPSIGARSTSATNYLNQSTQYGTQFVDQAMEFGGFLSQ